MIYIYMNITTPIIYYNKIVILYKSRSIPPICTQIYESQYELYILLQDYIISLNKWRDWSTDHTVLAEIGIIIYLIQISLYITGEWIIIKLTGASTLNPSWTGNKMIINPTRCVISAIFISQDYRPIYYNYNGDKFIILRT